MMQNAGVFDILTCNCAWRHSGVQFFHHFSTSERPKVVRTPQFFDILTWKCASRYSGVQFFHIATSKSGPPMRCFVHFDLKMFFSLQRRAIFPHRNFKKRSAHEVFCTFWLENVLLATAACNFSFPSWKATSAPAALTRLLFDPADTQIIEKHNISRLPQHFAPVDLLSTDFRAIVSSFFWLYFSSLLFHLLTLLLCSAFSTVHIVGS